jgi:hypothetical protein
MKRIIEIYVIDALPSGKAIKCSAKPDEKDSFILPKSQIKPFGTVRKKQVVKFEIPEWLYLSHWQLCGLAAFEEEKQRRKERENNG